MIVALSVLLLINAVFAFVVWPPFMRRIAADERSTDEAGNRTKFYTVHRTLIGSALALGAISGVAGIWGLVAG